MGKTATKTVEELCPMDDIFFEKLAIDIGFCQEVLQVILQKKDLKVIKTEPQKSLRNVQGRSVIVDVLCEDEKGRYYNIEIQKSNNDEHQRRVRYNGSNIDTYITEKGTHFQDLPELYVIYISDFDVFAKNRVIYHVERILRETGDFIDNGFHEVYVNAQVDDKSEISELMKLFKSSGTEGNKKFPVVSKAIKYLKIGKGRNEIMCKAVEEYAEMKTKEAVKRIVKNMLEKNKSDTEIMDCVGITEEELAEMKA